MNIFDKKNLKFQSNILGIKKKLNVQGKWKKIQTKKRNFGWSHITLNHDFIYVCNDVDGDITKIRWGS